jgi:PAS domain S-box-containing protein
MQMQRRIAPSPIGYVVAVAVTLAAAGLRLLLIHLVGNAVIFLPFILAVAVATWLGGLGPGLVAVVTSALLGDYLYAGPHYTLLITDLHEAVGLGAFLLISTTICILILALEITSRRAHASALEAFAQRERAEWLAEGMMAHEALRSSEERFRLLAEMVPSIVWTAAPDGTVSYVNRRWMEYCGFPADAAARQWPDLSLHPDDQERRDREWHRALRDGTGYEIELRHRRHDGVYRWFVTRAMPLRDEKGEILSWFGVTTDIHELKELQEQLREADRRKDEFLATLAHELRNPLAPLTTALENLKHAAGDAKLLELTRTMMGRQLRHMVTLVNDLLDVSRINLDKLDLRKERIDLSRILARAIETAVPPPERAQRVVTVMLPSEPVSLEADPVRLVQVFANLLSNACKFSPPGSRLWVGAQLEDHQAVVVIRDQGIGLEPEMLPRIFDLFVQVDRSLERAQPGLGIGLTLVKRLVEMHGGQIEARSEGLGRGSEFVVRLPLPATPSEMGGPAPAKGTGGDEMVSCRILVVDDNRDAAESFAMLLRIMGHQVTTAHDGQEAVEVWDEHRFDVVLMDLGLPRLNGYDAARRIRELPGGKDALLVAVSGWGQETDRRKSQEAGFDHHLVKPVDQADVARILADYCARSAGSLEV